MTLNPDPLYVEDTWTDTGQPDSYAAGYHAGFHAARHRLLLVGFLAGLVLMAAIGWWGR